MQTVHTLEFRGGMLKFSAGHFTIFSKTHRETMHGHTYQVEASITAEVGEPGITTDYRLFREKLVEYCERLDTRFLLPEQSPYFYIVEDGDYYTGEFAGKKLYFLKEDVILMPMSNITLETLSDWFINQLITDENFIKNFAIHSIQIKVFNGPEHAACATHVLTK